MAEKVEYKVTRLEGPEDQLEEQLNDQSPWILASLLYQPRQGASGPYLAIFYKKTGGSS